MGIFEKPLDLITLDDLRGLRDNRVCESLTHDYKLKLPTRKPTQSATDEPDSDFLVDASAFANTRGGLLLYGVKTARDQSGHDRAYPSAFPGLKDFNFDKERLRLGNSLRTGLDPPISNIQFREVVSPGASDAPLLLVRVPRSVVGPHMVTAGGRHEIYRRSESNNYPVEVTELREMFLTGVTWLDQVERFRRDRVDRIRAGGSGNPGFDISSSVFVHVLPIGRLDQLRDLRPHEEALRKVPPLTSAGWSYRFNTLGFMTFNSKVSYTQWFRHGGIEGYSSAYRGNLPAQFGGPLSLLHIEKLSDEVQAFAHLGVERIQSVLGLDPPFAVCLAAYGFLGSVIYLGPQFGEAKRIESDVELLPPIIVDEPSAPNLEEQLRFLLDVIWQSGGYDGAPRSKAIKK